MEFNALTSERLYFCPIDTIDSEAIHAYASDTEVSRYIGWALKQTLQETKDYVEEMIRREKLGTHLYATVKLKDTHRVIGTVMLFNFDHEAKNAEVGYVFHRQYWGRGYCSEALKMIDYFAFNTLKLHRVHARVVSGNGASARVLEKNNYLREGRLRDHYRIDNQFNDCLIYGKLQPSLVL